MARDTLESGGAPEPWSFDLPGDLIAQQPADRRGDSRLLLVEPDRGVAREAVFRDLPAHLRAGDLLVLNESRVLPARLATRRVDTGGQVEILLVGPEAAPRTWSALARPARRLRAGVELAVLGGEGTAPVLTVRERRDDGTVVVEGAEDPAGIAAARGVMPLPPYIRRLDDDPRGFADRTRYQTVYAAGDAASVAAPTAGLHFSEDTLVRLTAAGVGTARVSLHVGPGTFQPPTDAQIDRRRLHGEVFKLPADTARAVGETRRRGGRVIAVGTTSLRVLESAARLDLPEPTAANEGWVRRFDDPDSFFTGEALCTDGAWEVAGTTHLFIAPPDRVACVDGLLTNFHLPGSSLLMLVAAVLGGETWRAVYRHAVAEGLRFYSYGDCMLVLPAVGETS
ncbi:MAG: S-adenosylmethionine:tRNA ribosyltransferase-isomerase [bacterium]|nr:S-adenosylmethionine:tRNA ribosyltransferase-isomerase [bacterium]